MTTHHLFSLIESPEKAMDSKSSAPSCPVTNALDNTQSLEVECFRALIQPSLTASQSDSTSTLLSETRRSRKIGSTRMLELLRQDLYEHQNSIHRNISKHDALSSITMGSELESPRTLSPIKNNSSDLIGQNDHRSKAFSYIVNNLHNRSTRLLNEGIKCREISTDTLERFDEKLGAVQHEASRFSRRVSSLSARVEERSQVNKRFRAKVKALLAISEKIQSRLDALDYENEVD
ncbi:hypothetical protein FGIG_01792 [Fasciola gigantica]|uniref:Uncharacterized protein n=1 Tax=Fasciola gigantica TaxID=46835 RepID=A0A504Z2D3_FASGI|nr:hypothetical protein FGIG_01792 [Fasciola gigantica]